MGASDPGLATAGFAGAGIAQLGTSVVEAGAAKTAGRIQAQQLEFNAKLAELNAQDAMRRGEKEAKKIRKQTKQVVGAQRAALAAQGIDVDVDTGADIQESAEVIGRLDEETVRTNARKEAFGLKVAAEDLRGQAGLTRFAAKSKARTSLLTGGIGALGFGAQAYQAGSK